MAKEGVIFKLLLDGIPRTIPEIATETGLSDTYCTTLCTALAARRAIFFRKSAGTWIAWMPARGRHVPAPPPSCRDLQQSEDA